MPKPIGSFINDLAIKFGVPSDSQSLKDLLSKSELSQITLPDDLINAMESNMHTLDSAKAKLRTTLKTELLGETFNTVNTELDTIATENGFDDASRAELQNEKNTYNRIKLVAKKIKDLEAAKAGTGKGDKAELEKRINELQAKESSLIKEWEGKLASEKSSAQESINSMGIDTMLSRYNYALGEIDPEVKIMTARGLVDKAMLAAGVKVINDPTNPKVLKLVKQDGTDYYDEKQNKKDLKSFIEGVTAPILSTTKPADNGSAGNNQATIVEGGKQQAVNQSAMERITAEIAQAER